MLVGFHVGNFLSFDGRQRFTMICMPRSTIPECAVTFDGYGLLRMSAVYGANGSGKSNLLRSMGAMRSLVVDDVPPAINGYHVSERRNEAEPSLFDMEIRIGDRTYSYGFDYMVRKQEVVDEWLHEIFVGRESKVLFERTGGTIVHSFEGRDATAVDSCAQDIPDMPGRLFLNEMYRHMCIDGAGPEIIAKVMRWFRDRLRILDSRMLSGTSGGTGESFESDGTRKLSRLRDNLTAAGGDTTFLVDDIDANLHPNAVRRLLDSFLEDGGRRNQLVFTTHEPSLMDSKPLGRMEIWFAEMDSEGASHLYSLYEFKDSGCASVEKAYLEGRFGAVPFRSRNRPITPPLPRPSWISSAKRRPLWRAPRR